MIQFLADENIAISTVSVLGKNGYLVNYVREGELKGAVDDILFDFCQEVGYIFLTKDTDFCNILKYRPVPPAGIIVIRIKDEYPSMITDMLLKFLKVVADNFCEGKLVILEKDRFRVRNFV